MSEQNDFDKEIELYSLLIDQLFKHQTNIWQIPTALLTGNLVAIYYFKSDQVLPLIAIILWLFNIGLILGFYQMKIAQEKIIAKITDAEKELKRFSKFLPNIENHKIKAPDVFLVILILFEIILTILIIYFCAHCFCASIKYFITCVLTSHSS